MINVTIITVDTPLASGQVLGQWVFTMLDSNGAQVDTQSVDVPEASFASPTAGVYTMQAKRIDSTGVVFGAVGTSAPFTIEAVMGQSVGVVNVTIA